MIGNNRTTCINTESKKNSTKVLSVERNDGWSGEVHSGDGNILVTVNSVSGLFSRSAKMKRKQPDGQPNKKIQRTV